MNAKRFLVTLAAAAAIPAAVAGPAGAAVPTFGEESWLNTASGSEGAAHPATALSASGDSTIAWVNHGKSGSWTLEYSQADPHGVQDGSVQAAGSESKSDNDPGRPAIAAERTGGAVILQRYYDGANWAVSLVRVFADGSHRLWPHLSSWGRDSTDPLVSVGPTGSGVAAWLTDETGAGGWVLHWVAFSSTGKPGAIQSANPVKVVAKKWTVPVVAAYPTLSATSGGVATLAYRARDVAKGKYSITAVRISAAGKATKTVSVSAASASSVKDIASASAANGTTAIAWSAGVAAGNVIKVALVDSAGRVKTVLPSFGYATDDSTIPSVAISPTGLVAVVWQEAGAEATSIEGVRISASGNPGPWGPIRSSTAITSFVRPQVVMGNDGSALIGWIYNITTYGPDPGLPEPRNTSFASFARMSTRSTVTESGTFASSLEIGDVRTPETEFSMAANAAGGATVGLGFTRVYDSVSIISRFTIAP